MENYPNQAPIDKEISINPSAVFNFKISPNLIIDYANHLFCEVSGYEEYELIGESLEKIIHPDMPMIFMDKLSKRLENKDPMRLVTKLLAKDGRYFWLLIDFETKIDDDKNILAHYSNSRPAPQYAIHKMSTLHKILSKIEEKTGGSKASKRYLIGFLEERNMDYNQYIEELSIKRPEYEKPFQDQNFIHKSVQQSENTDPHFNAVNYNSNFDASNSETASKRKPKKKKSLLKKVFGK